MILLMLKKTVVAEWVNVGGLDCDQVVAEEILWVNLFFATDYAENSKLANRKKIECIL